MRYYPRKLLAFYFICSFMGHREHVVRGKTQAHHLCSRCGAYLWGGKFYGRARG